MQTTIKTKSGQTLADIAVEYYGDLSEIDKLASDNNLSMSAEIEAGTDLIVDLQENNDVVDYYADNDVHPASKEDTTLSQGGIGYMAIGFDFLVS